MTTDPSGFRVGNDVCPKCCASHPTTFDCEQQFVAPLVSSDGQEPGSYFQAMKAASDKIAEQSATIERLSAERMQLREALTNPAAAASLRMLRAHYDKARCDNEAVACCIRCNVMFLVNSAESAALSNTAENG